MELTKTGCGEYQTLGFRIVRRFARRNRKNWKVYQGLNTKPVREYQTLEQATKYVARQAKRLYK